MAIEGECGVSTAAESKKTNSIDMLHGPLAKKIVLFSIPLAITSILQQLLNSTDAVFAGQWLGGDALAAVGGVAPIISLFVAEFEKVNTSEWNKMMSRVKQGLSPSEGDVTDETTGTVMASSGSGGSGSGDSGSGGASGSSLSGTKISVKNGNGTQGCASDAAAKLTPQGAVCETGNADDSNYAKTLVIYDGDNADKAQKVADLLGCGTVMKNDGRYTYAGDILVVVGQDWK